MKKSLYLAVTAVGVTLWLLALSTTNLLAASATTTLTVSASVTANCTISTGALAFGSYDPVGANASSPLDATGTVTIACTKGSTNTIGLDLGSNASGSTRRMASGSERLTYEMYKDSSRTQVWGNSGTDLYDAGTAPSKAARSFNVYGQVPAGQDVGAGSYSDTVVATVNF